MLNDTNISKGRTENDSDVMELKDCFVIMPFSTTKTHSSVKWAEIFEEFFIPAWLEFGIKCHRTNVPRGSITKDIIEKLFSASIVLADLTDSNPNVLYELGVRHAFKKPSIMVKQKGTEIPFDVNDYNVFEYEYTPKGLEKLKAHIGSVIDDIKTYPTKGDNPVWDFLNILEFTIDYIGISSAGHQRMTMLPKGAYVTVDSSTTPVLLTAGLSGRNYLKIYNENIHEINLCDKNGVMFDVLSHAEVKEYDLLPTIEIYGILSIELVGPIDILVVEEIR